MSLGLMLYIIITWQITVHNNSTPVACLDPIRLILGGNGVRGLTRDLATIPARYPGAFSGRRQGRDITAVRPLAGTKLHCLVTGNNLPRLYASGSTPLTPQPWARRRWRHMFAQS